MQTPFKGWSKWQLDVAAEMYPNNPDLQLELIKRRRIENQQEQQALTKQAKEIRDGR